MKYVNYNQRGYTLIEIVVATGILMMMITLMTGILARYFTAQRLQIAQQTIQEDVRFALELMTREIRTGYGSTFTLADGSGQALTFRNQNGTCVEYRLNTKTGQIERGEVNAPGDICPSDAFKSVTFAAITSHNTVIQFLRFDPTRSNAAANGFPDRQGFVVIDVKAAPSQGSQLTITLQTTAASRQIILFEPQQP